MSLASTVEAVLFASAERQPLAKLASLVQVELSEVLEALDALDARYASSGSALQLIRHAGSVELVTRPEYAEMVRQAIRADATGELSKPSLEALSILAYRGPLTRPELEQIRGVQSAMILRNLVMRGLVEMKEDVRMGQPVYGVTGEFLKTVGVPRVEALPDFETLHHHPVVQQVLAELDESAPTPRAGDATLQT